MRPLSVALWGVWLNFDLRFLDGAITPHMELNSRQEEQGVKVGATESVGLHSYLMAWNSAMWRHPSYKGGWELSLQLVTSLLQIKAESDKEEGRKNGYCKDTQWSL